MKFVYITDSHIGGRNFNGWQMQPRYSESAAEILAALDKVVRRENASLVIHGGDITDNGTADEIKNAAYLFEKYLSVPVAAVLGNHDIMEPDCDELWLENGSKFFNGNAIDNTLILDGLRFDFLSLCWGAESRAWVKSEGQLIRMNDEHYAVLRSGRTDLPRIIVMHAQIRPMMPEKTGLDYPLLEVENDFRKTGDALVKEFSPILILSGHNHLNLVERVENCMAVSASSLTEMPFECRIFEIIDRKITMKTVSLAEELDFKGDYISEQSYVQGTPADRVFEVVF